MCVVAGRGNKDEGLRGTGNEGRGTRNGMRRKEERIERGMRDGGRGTREVGEPQDGWKRVKGIKTLHCIEVD